MPPQVRYRLGEDWQLPSSDMRGLSELLAELAIRLEPGTEDIQHLGRQGGRYLAGRPGGDPTAAIPRALERLGFDAEIEARQIRLRSCPCPLVSPQQPELICSLGGAPANPLKLRRTPHDRA